METLLRALEPYKHLDPGGWLALFRLLPVWAGVLLALVGVGLLARGGGALFRVVAGPLGVMIGQIWVGPLATRLGFQTQAGSIALAASALLAVLGLAVPASTVFFGFGIPIGLMAATLAGPDWLLGFVPAFIVGGAVGVVLERPVSVLLAATSGAWLLVLGLMAALSGSAGGLVERLAAHWPAAISVAAVFAVAGFGYQIFVMPPPEKAAQRARERAQAKQAEAEKKALEKRWASYSKGRKGGD
ncbi:MAG: hypothetical protein INH41_09230 [Myxococcaceae bacterium]|nr:hypothetical protein [Myxococcaceae bacterium]